VVDGLSIARQQDVQPAVTVARLLACHLNQLLAQAIVAGKAAVAIRRRCR